MEKSRKIVCTHVNLILQLSKFTKRDKLLLRSGDKWKPKVEDEEREFNEIMRRMGEAYARESGFKNGQRYIRDLMSEIERKNGWQMAEALGDTTPYSIQQFLYRGGVDADKARKEIVRSKEVVYSNFNRER
ncbi:MAG: hypothetical protein FWB91_12050 [Defluviitaleaceae bacterium]|nr:hypothetical protein [Defluviitaleaceae bacterium]